MSIGRLDSRLGPAFVLVHADQCALPFDLDAESVERIDHQATEYAREFGEGLAPVLGAPFIYKGPDPVHAEFFFGLYFAMTSLHALHLICGVIVIGGILALWPRTIEASRFRRVQAIGLYWHFVDIVWVFLFPVLYLINR
ncbi:cytochrome c oxidase subunit 3 [Mesorhizobium sp. M1403]|uniref:cytochrome c oxidase subunit 3 n=1 Tax=Mesorhizobium sp. M1403 TaxID=2957097 RepID=UPI003335F0A2